MDKMLLIADVLFELLPVVFFAGLWWFIPESRDTILFLYLTAIYTKILVVNRRVDRL